MLRVHLAICDGCTNFNDQVAFLRKADGAALQTTPNILTAAPRCGAPFHCGAQAESRAAGARPAAGRAGAGRELPLPRLPGARSSKNVARQVLVLRQLAQPRVDVRASMTIVCRAALRRRRTRRPPAAAPSRCRAGARRCSRSSRSPANAISARRRIASGLKSSFTPSVASSAWYWRTRHASVAVRICSKSSTERRVELDADRKAALQLRDQVRGLRQVERAARDEQDVVGLDHAVLGRDGGAFDQRQQVALHALARDVGAVRLRAAGDLVDLVEEHDAVLLDVRERAAP